MLPEIEKIRGIHPGYILKRALNSNGIKSSELAASIAEHKQTISAIIKQKRKITPALSIKLAKTFNVPKDYFMHLQASYEVKTVASGLEKEKKPNLSKFRKVLFWDTNLNSIDWENQKQAIIQRVLERGNATEIEELINFYGKASIAAEIKKIKNVRIKEFYQNINQFNLV